MQKECWTAPKASNQGLQMISEIAQSQLRKSNNQQNHDSEDQAKQNSDIVIQSQIAGMTEEKLKKPKRGYDELDEERTEPSVTIEDN
jgi:hypothetical protein